jgi:plasmid stabilization system protein ParE
MTFRYLTPAQKELDWQMGEYEDRSTGLGQEFLDEVEATISRVMANPRAWSQIDSGLRRCLTDRFPSGVVYHYRENHQEIVIVAVAHTHRNPGYWKNRFKTE